MRIKSSEVSPQNDSNITEQSHTIRKLHSTKSTSLLHFLACIEESISEIYGRTIV